ncbi:dihydrolipoyl dehydrogenase [Candidatus Woesearchaeota archaeon]|nr:dihydrolipoyl dehydrogenase [Candidatus Woesearchaeota archaeon]
MKKRYFDVIVIGAGSGLEISSFAAAQGLKTAIIEPGPFGGTCLNRGCIPSKMLIQSADVMETIRTSQKFGITGKATKVDWAKIVSRVNKLIDEDSRQIEQANKKSKNLTAYKEYAQFIGKKELLVGKEIITADKIFICAGARPSIPPIPGLKEVPYLTSDEALRLKKQPKTLTIIGGGYIGTELAHFYGSLGTKVTILQRNNLLMSNEDTEIAQTFTRIARQKYNIIFNATTKQVYKKAKQIAADIEVNGKKKTILGEQLLVAAGRQPNTDLLNCKAGGIELTDKGFVKVNAYLETNVPGIWAIGDIAGIYMFKHSANLEAGYAIQNSFGKKIPVDYSAMPHAAFSSPQVASVGKTEDELIEENKKYAKNVHYYRETGYGAAIQEEDGFVKVLVDPNTREILGCHIIGPDASMLIHEVIVAMKAKLGAKGIVDAVHVHPALSEVVQRAFQF